MTEISPDPDQNRGQWWAQYVVPTALGVEAFAWRVAWFVLLLRLLSII